MNVGLSLVPADPGVCAPVQPVNAQILLQTHEIIRIFIDQKIIQAGNGGRRTPIYTERMGNR